MMTKADYEKLADALFTARPRSFAKGSESLVAHMTEDTWLKTVEAMADTLKKDNPAFAYDKFNYRAGAVATSKGFRGIDWDI